MLNAERVDRLLEARDFEEAARILTEYGYEDMSEMSADQIEVLLSQRRAGIFSEIARICPDAEVVDVFRIKYDYHNAKVLIKAEGMGIDAGHLLSDCGCIAAKVIESEFRSGSYNRIPMIMSEPMREARELMGRSSNPQLVDFMLDKAYFAELLTKAERIESPFLLRYARLLIDSANLRSVVRTIRMGRGSDFMKSVIIPGGNVGIKRLSVVEMSPDGLTAAFSMSPLKEAAVLGGAVIAGGELTAFEQACDNAVTRYLCKAKTKGFGDDPVISYLAAVEGELTTVRMILTGLKAGVDPQILKERLRDLYV